MKPRSSSALPPGRQRAARSVKQTLLGPVKAWLATRSPRERQLLVTAVAVVLVGAFWAVAVAPAWRVIRTASAAQAEAAAQLQRMQTIANEVQALREAPDVSPQQASQALTQASERYFGDTGKLVLSKDQATLQLNHATPQALTAWLDEIRLSAHALPVSAHLTRVGDGPEAAWQGTVVITPPTLAQEAP
ncbi:MAG: type II secretion system protein GspM [Pseudoxanthomonas sp.]